MSLKKKRKTKIVKIKPRLPIAIENTYNSFLKEMMRFVFKITNEQAKPIKSSFFTQKEKENTVKNDSNEAEEIVIIFNQLKKKYRKKYSDRVLRNEAERIFNQTNEFNRNEQARMLNIQTNSRLGKKTISNEIILSNTSRNITATKQVFIENNIKLIKSIPNKFFADLEQDVMRITQKQGRAKELAEQIRKRYNTSKKKADLISRDQISKLNGNLAQQRQEDVGIKKYVWETSQDERVRSSHASKQGKVFAWNDPPSDTGHPGQDYRCRCVAISVLE